MTLADEIAAAVAEAQTAPTETHAQIWRESIVERRVMDAMPDDPRVLRMWAINTAARSLFTNPGDVLVCAQQFVDYVTNGPVTA